MINLYCCFYIWFLIQCTLFYPYLLLIVPGKYFNFWKYFSLLIILIKKMIKGKINWKINKFTFIGPHKDFKVRILLQFRWRDVRLAFNQLAPSDSAEVVCQRGIVERIWIPNIYITNEKHSLTMADLTEDLMVTVLPDGNVMLSVRCDNVGLNSFFYMFVNKPFGIYIHYLRV